jgi:lamin tail-like protein
VRLVGFFVILLCSMTILSTATVSGAGGHGCAPLVPPGIPGSPAPAPSAPGSIVINEVLLVPHSTWNCSESSSYFSTTDAWIELYNTQNQAFNLYAAHALIDSGSNTNAFSFPFGTAIAAHGYLVVFPRTNSAFVSSETAILRLVIPQMVVDQVTVPPLGQDQSYARTSDGAASWKITSTPSIDASNTSQQVTPTAITSSTGPGGTASARTSVGSYSGDHKVLVDGVQPEWDRIQVPSATPTAGVVLHPTTPPASTVSPGGSGSDLPRRIGLTVLITALAATLFWCWKVFKKV